MSIAETVKPEVTEPVVTIGGDKSDASRPVEKSPGQGADGKIVGIVVGLLLLFIIIIIVVSPVPRSLERCSRGRSPVVSEHGTHVHPDLHRLDLFP